LKIEWTETAQSQLLALDAWLFERSSAGAEHVVDRIADRILEIVGSLDRFPLAGRPGRVGGTREMVVPSTSYIIAYRIHEETLQVLAIMHGAQRWPRSFDR
jgi:addiction module RelE/StbE family toxin